MSSAPEPAGDVSSEELLLVQRAYAAYNAMDADGLLELVTDDVDWPDGSARLRGRAALRAYWLAQWRETRTHDRPVTVSRDHEGRTVVEIEQVVRTADGVVVSTGRFRHRLRVTAGRIARLDIESL